MKEKMQTTRNKIGKLFAVFLLSVTIIQSVFMPVLAAPAETAADITEAESHDGDEIQSFDSFLNEIKKMDWSKESMQEMSKDVGNKIKIDVKEADTPDMKTRMKTSAFNIVKEIIKEAVRLLKRNFIYIIIIIILVLILKIRKKRGDNEKWQSK